MLNYKNMLFVTALSFLSGLSASFAEPRIVMIPEMSDLPFEKYGELSKDYRISAEEEVEWKSTLPFINHVINDQMVRDLSTSARDEMATYHYLGLNLPKLELYGANSSLVIYEATLDQLPSATKGAKRLFKVYIEGFRMEKRFLPNTFILTIREADAN